MTNRLIIILIMLQVATLSYVLFVNRNETPGNKTQALTTPDASDVLATIHEIKTELRDLKKSVQQQNDNEISQSQVRQDIKQVETIENNSSPIETKSDTAMNQHSVDESNSVVAAAINRARWQQSDTQVLMHLAPELSRTQKSKLLNQIADAVNNQQLRLDAALPPM